jgi:hypothetical protein
MQDRNQAQHGHAGSIVGGLLILCSVSVERDAKRIAFTPTRLYNPDQPAQDWRGIKVDGSTPFYLEAKDKDTLAQLEGQFQHGQETTMQVGSAPANITTGGDNKS